VRRGSVGELSFAAQDFRLGVRPFRCTTVTKQKLSMQVEEDIHWTLVFIDDFKHLKSLRMNVNAELFGITSNDDLRRRVMVRGSS